MSWSRIKRLAVHTYDEWSDAEAPRMGAALAFYTMLSLAPLLLMLTGIAALVFDPMQVRQAVSGQITSLIGKDSAEAIEQILERASTKEGAGTVASIVGFVTLLVGASSVAMELRNSLNKIFVAKAPEGFAGFIKERSYAIVAVLGAGFLLLVSLIISAALSAASKYLQGRFPIPPQIFEILNFLASLAVFAAVIAAIFKWLPTHSPGWRQVAIGSVMTAILFTIGKTLIGLYIGTAAVGSTFGAAGSLVVLLVWAYYSTQIFFFGAEFTKVLARDYQPSAKVSAAGDREPVQLSLPDLPRALPAPAPEPRHHGGLINALSRFGGSLVGLGSRAKDVFTAH